MSRSEMILRARGRLIRFPRRTMVMGIVNINDDSFCGDGTLDGESAMEQAMEQVRAGADMIDAGAESARTNRAPVSIDEEIRRLVPFIHRWTRWQEEAGSSPAVPGQLWPPMLSLNTWRPEVVAEVLPEGGDLLNDLGSLTDDRNAGLCARFGAALLIMHSRGRPKEKHTHIQYPDIMQELGEFFTSRIALAMAAGMPADSLVLDPGIDFAKQRADNLRIFRELERLHCFGHPILLPVSRKTVIGEVLQLRNPLERDAGTMACTIAGVLRGAHIVRVHNVAAAVAGIRIMAALDEGD